MVKGGRGNSADVNVLNKVNELLLLVSSEGFTKSHDVEMGNIRAHDRTTSEEQNNESQKQKVPP